MRLTAKRLSVGVAVLTAAGAIAAAAVTLLPGAKQAAGDRVIENELCIVAPATPYDPASGLPMLAPRPIPAGARCPVCGMYPARSPRWAAQSIFKDGASHSFDSPIDLFFFLQRVSHYDSRYTSADVAANFVTDFESGQWIEASSAFFVQGSHVLGPMRDADLPAFASREAAETFARNRGGKTVTFTDITPELIASLNRNVHTHR